MADAARTARARARAELTREIVEAARRRLATEGAAALSLRAVARDLGLVSSAVYRYVASREDLLTLLIVEAYDALGAAAERAEAKVDRADLGGRWLAACHGVRRWALRHPHEYALLFGSPVPGYAAPADTVGPATRVPVLLLGILFDASASASASASGEGEVAAPAGLPDPVRRALVPLRSAVPDSVPDDLLLRGVMAWTYLFGAVSFELFGHRHQVLADPAAAREAFFAEECRRIGALAGLTS